MIRPLHEWSRERDSKGRNLLRVPRRPFLRVSRILLSDYGLPWWYRIGYKDLDRNAYLVAWPGFHLVLRLYAFWQRHRWSFHDLALKVGAAELEEGGYYRDTCWWPGTMNFSHLDTKQTGQ